MKAPEPKEIVGWNPSVYYAESLVECPIGLAWKALLDFEAWNPTFVGAKVTPVSGDYRSEGEIIKIHKAMATVKGEPLPEFYAKTVKVVPERHIVWYVYLPDASMARNFVDFGLSETPSGCKFNIYYYAQDQLSDDLLAAQRKSSQATFEATALAFKKYCEAKARGA